MLGIHSSSVRPTYWWETTERVQAKCAQAEGVEDPMFNLQSLGTESDVNNVDKENLVNNV